MVKVLLLAHTLVSKGEHDVDQDVVALKILGNGVGGAHLSINSFCSSKKLYNSTNKTSKYDNFKYEAS